MLIISLFIFILSCSLILNKSQAINYGRAGIILLLNCIYICYNNYYIFYIQNGLGLLGGLFSISSNSLTFQLLIIIISMLILNLTGFYSRKHLTVENFSLSKLMLKKLTIISNVKKEDQYTIIEYPIIIIFIIIGSMILISSNDLISLYISIELQSYGLYILCTIYRNSESSTASGLTYFLLGGLSSCFILLGIGIIYSYIGTTYIENFYIITNILNIVDNTISLYSYISYGLLLITVGFLFKMSAAPFHFWSPDVYDGIPTVVTTFVAIIPKISILVILLYIFHFTYNQYSLSEFNWTSNLLISSLLSLILGTILGLTQFRIKRLLAYSTISHLGFLLLGLTINSVESIQSFIFYLIQYSISNLNAFFILLGIGYSLFFFIDKNNSYINLLDKNNSPVQLISQLKGYFYINPLLALSFAITLFSFAGIPPLVGFFGKQMILSAALEDGFVFMALVGVICSVISAVYYLNIIKTIFFFENPYTSVSDNQDLLDKIELKSIKYSYSDVSLTNALSIIISILTLIIVLFMFTPNSILHLSNLLSLILFAL